MRLSRALPALAATTLALPGTAYSLVPGGHAPPRPSSRLHSTPSAEDMQRAMKEQSENPEVLAQSAAAMKNMTPEDMEKLIAQMEGMPASERESLKKVGMNPDTSEWTRARAAATEVSREHAILTPLSQCWPA